MERQDAHWYDAFPAPRLEPDVMPQQRALMVLSMRIASMLIIDVRRNDYEGGAIRGSLNIPAQGFWWNRGMLYELAYKAGMEWVVFTCGSSQGRGPRCASWFLEHVREVVGDKDMHVMVLEGGIKGWVQGGPQFIQFMDGFQQDYWQRLFASGDSGNQAVQQVSVQDSSTYAHPAQPALESSTNSGTESTAQSSKRPLSSYQDDRKEKRIQW